MRATLKKFIKAKLMVPLPVLLAVVILLVAGVIIVQHSFETKPSDASSASGIEDMANPFGTLSASEIADVTVAWFPEWKDTSEIVLDEAQIEEMVEILHRQTLYKEDLTGEIYWGMSVTYHITKTDGSTTDIIPSDSLLTIDDTRYEASEDSCKELYNFAFHTAGIEP